MTIAQNMLKCVQQQQKNPTNCINLKGRNVVLGHYHPCETMSRKINASYFYFQENYYHLLSLLQLFRWLSHSIPCGRE